MLSGNERRPFYRILFPGKDSDRGMAARVPDVNETRLNDNFKIISDEFKKIWDFIKNGFSTKSMAVDGELDVSGDTTVDGNLSATGNASVSGDMTAATFNGFLGIERTTIANGSMDIIGMPNSSSAFLLASGIRDGSKFISSVRANSAGDVSHIEFGTPPDATFAASTNRLTIANNSNGEMQIIVLRF